MGGGNPIVNTVGGVHIDAENTTAKSVAGQLYVNTVESNTHAKNVVYWRQVGLELANANTVVINPNVKRVADQLCVNTVVKNTIVRNVAYLYVNMGESNTSAKNVVYICRDRFVHVNTVDKNPIAKSVMSHLSANMVVIGPIV